MSQKYRFSLDDAIAADVEALAADMGISVSQLAAQAVSLFVARHPSRSGDGWSKSDQPVVQIGPAAVPLRALDEQSYVNKLLKPHDDDTTISMIHQLWQLERRVAPNDEIRESHDAEAFELKRLIALRRKQVVESKGLTGGPV